MSDQARVYYGKLETLGDFDSLCLDGNPLTEWLEEDDWAGKKVFVRYFISDSPISSLEEAVERHVKTVMGVADVEYHLVYGTEWTGQYALDQTLKVEGHDLLQELESHVGKYLVLEVRCD